MVYRKGRCLDQRCTVFSLSPLTLSVQGMTYAITVMLMTRSCILSSNRRTIGVMLLDV